MEGKKRRSRRQECKNLQRNLEPVVTCLFAREISDGIRVILAKNESSNSVRITIQCTVSDTVVVYIHSNHNYELIAALVAAKLQLFYVENVSLQNAMPTQAASLLTGSNVYTVTTKKIIYIHNYLEDNIYVVTYCLKFLIFLIFIFQMRNHK